MKVKYSRFNFAEKFAGFVFFPKYSFNLSDKKGMEPFLYKWDGDENSLYTDSTYGCNNNSNNGSGAYCTAIIQRNGWKIPKNYPRRISF